MSKTNKNNNLLISGDYPLIASPTLAKAFGVTAANFLQKLHYFLENNEGKTFNGKKYWFHSYEQWQSTLGVYSISTIKRIVAKLKRAGILVIEKLAQNKWLQTNFYTINYKKLKQFIKVDSQQDHQAKVKSPISAPVAAPRLQKPATAHTVQPTALINSIQQAFQNIKVRSNTFAPTLKVAKESRIRPDFVTRESYSIVGLSQPLHPAASKEILKNMDMDYRCFYQALRQQRVDIDYDDHRIQQLLKYQKQIIRHIVYIKQNFAGHERYQWHTLEQLQMENYFKK